MTKPFLLFSALCLLLAACGGEATPQTSVEPPATQATADTGPPSPPHVPPLEGADGVVLADINWQTSGDTLVMFGLAENSGTKDLYDVLAMVRLLDASGQVVDAGSRELPFLPAGGQAPFVILFSADQGWEGYDAIFAELPAGPNTVLHPDDFEIVSAQQIPGSCHSLPDTVFDLSVEVRNTGRRGDAFELLAALFAEDGRLIGVSAAWMCTELDESIFFEVSVGAADIAEGDIAGYELFVYGYVLGD